MNNDDILKMARESGLFTHKEVQPELLRFARLVAEAERNAVIELLSGIDQTDIENPDGWWETSTGAKFGAGRIAAIRARGEA
jgi:hypothetical protein